MGDHCLVGPQAHLAGCQLGDRVFVATGAAVFHGAQLGNGSEVRVHGVVHILTHLPADAVVPIGWVAVGSPCRILPPDKHDEIWTIQQPLNFPATVYAVDRESADVMGQITRKRSEQLGSHRSDKPV